jgi:hypothetical protein
MANIPLTLNYVVDQTAPELEDPLLRTETRKQLSKAAIRVNNQRNFLDKKTYNAVVVQVFDAGLPAEQGTTLRNIFEKVAAFFPPNGNISDNPIQCRAIVPDLHDSVVPIPDIIDLPSISVSGPYQKFLNLVPIFYAPANSFNIVDLNVGSIIEVEFNDNNYNEGRIIKVLKSAVVNPPTPIPSTPPSPVPGSGGSTGGGPSLPGTPAPYSGTPQATNCNEAIQELFDLIASHESGGSYDAMNRGACKDCSGTGGAPRWLVKGGSNNAGSGPGNQTGPLSTRTIQNIRYWQSLPLPSETILHATTHRLFAAGKYQIIIGTMGQFLKYLKVPEDSQQIFDPTFQEQFKDFILKSARPSVGNYVFSRNNDLIKAALELAKEFASIGVPTNTQRKAKINGKSVIINLTKGDSYYKGVGNNKAATSPDEIMALLQNARNRCAPNP